LWVPAKEGGTDKLKQVGKYETEEAEKRCRGQGDAGLPLHRRGRRHSEMEFQYKRPFEKDKEPAKSSKVTVQVE